MPLQSLQAGHWFKLICGASFQHLSSVRNLTLAYTLAGADCIDVAADPAVVYAARSAIEAAANLKRQGREQGDLPWLMVSLNAGEDPHFRKADLNPDQCPTDCSRPCVSICPAQAITFSDLQTSHSGVIEERCYGCGRCLPVCPIKQITTRSEVAQPTVIGPFIQAGMIDAVEIHTQVGQFSEFQVLWKAIAPYVNQLQVLAISCPDGEGLIAYLRALYAVMAPLPCPLIWQTDGRPMSGDIGDGTTRACVKLGQKVLKAQLPGYVQLAGGTNRQTVAKLKANGLLYPQAMAQTNEHQSIHSHRYVAGVAYGSFARKLLDPIQATLNAQPFHSHDLEAVPDLLAKAVLVATSLVSQLKPDRHLWDKFGNCLPTSGRDRDSPPLSGMG